MSRACSRRSSRVTRQVEPDRVVESSVPRAPAFASRLRPRRSRRRLAGTGFSPTAVAETTSEPMTYASPVESPFQRPRASRPRRRPVTPSGRHRRRYSCLRKRSSSGIRGTPRLGGGNLARAAGFPASGGFAVSTAVRSSSPSRRQLSIRARRSAAAPIENFIVPVQDSSPWILRSKTLRSSLCRSRPIQSRWMAGTRRRRHRQGIFVSLHARVSSGAILRTGSLAIRSRAVAEFHVSEPFSTFPNEPAPHSSPSRSRYSIPAAACRSAAAALDCGHRPRR